jgi:hypothetical protein
MLDMLNRKVTEILSVMEDLGDILRRENEALTIHQVDVIKDTLPLKTKLSNQYAEEFKTLTSDVSSLKHLGAERKNALIGGAMQLNGLMEENALRLKASMTANRSLLNVIVSEVKKVQEAKESFYDEKGRIRKRKEAEANSLTFNQVL